MLPNDDSIPLLPPMTEEEIEAFYRKIKKQPLTDEDKKWYENPGPLVPMDEVIVELDKILKTRSFGN
jgi:hypothetical protein